MKILVISNLYPPYFIGGYELGCRDVVEQLKYRGHEVIVLTSSYGIKCPKQDKGVFRWLQGNFIWNLGTQIKALKLIVKEINNHLCFKILCTTFKPDIVYVWNLTHVSISLIFKAQNMDLPVSFFVFDNWLSHWENDNWYSLCKRQPQRLFKKFIWKLIYPLLKFLGIVTTSNSLDLRYAHFATKYLQKLCLQSGKLVSDSKVIYWGLEKNYFSNKKKSEHSKHLLYVGQIVPHKGVHTLIESLNIIIQNNYKSIKLTIAGGTVFPDYEVHIHSLISSLNLEKHVHFTGLIPRENINLLYKKNDILIFPSIWDEPFGITLIEAMASGLAVVATGTGGSAEFLEHEVNALLFPKEDAKACATQIMRLIDNPDLFERIRQNGRRTVEEKFRFETTIDKIEDILKEAAGK